MIEYVVVYFKVKYVVLCGYIFCGGVVVVLGDFRVGGVLDMWFVLLRVVRYVNKEVLDVMKDERVRGIKIVELNVEVGVNVLMVNVMVREVIEEWGL